MFPVVYNLKWEKMFTKETLENTEKQTISFLNYPTKNSL